MEKELKIMVAGTVAVVTLAATALVGIAVITGFKDSGSVDNTTADKFTAGIGVFATFIGIVVLTVVGKSVIGLIRGK